MSSLTISQLDQINTKLGKYISGGKSTAKEVSSYYEASHILYRRFHSREGAMHLPLELEPGKRHSDKLLEQARQVNQIIRDTGGRRVLELGSGLGFNISNLARENPEVSFTGVDISGKGISFASKKYKKLSNLQFRLHDFNKIKKLKGEKYDLIFAVETLCHADDILQIIEGCSEILTDGGYLVIFDGWNTSKNKSETETRAYKLLCWGFALNTFHDLPQFQILKDYSVKENTDLTKAVEPNLQAFLQGSLRVLKYHRIIQWLTRSGILPTAYIKQLSAGLLSLYFLENGFMEYRKLVLQLHLKT